MDPHRLTRTLRAGLAGTIRRARARRGRAIGWPTADQPQDALSGVRRINLIPQADEARRNLVVWTLWLLARDWDGEDSHRARLMFETALRAFMAVVAPHVTVTPFGYGESPTDAAYLGIQQAVLRLVCVELGHDPDRSGSSHELDAAEDALDTALGAYIAAASPAR